MTPSERRALEKIAARRLPRNWAVTHELARELARASRAMGRRLGLLIDRGGKVFCICLGDAHRVEIPDITFDRVSPSRLRGLRFVHTHLSQGVLEDVALLDLARFRLDVTVQLQVDEAGEPSHFSLAHLVPPEPRAAEAEDVTPYEVQPPRAIHGLPGDFDHFIQTLEEEYARKADALRGNAKNRERAILVGVGLKGRDPDLDRRMRELASLTEAAGVTVCETVTQRRDTFDPRYLVGKGKLDKLVMKSLEHQATVLVFDRDLSPAQAKAIASRTDLKIIDRTQLILDIFAQRAKSADGKLQVELARLRYLMPHLVGGGRSLSRIRGGIGGNRGVGEQKLELDRRRFRDRIRFLERSLDRVCRRRAENRKHRQRHDARLVALVGYTNAGKSTWMSALTGADVHVADQLFATLDTTARRLELPHGTSCVLADTVGFVRDLPDDLVAAFRATLDELADASLLVHVVDASDPEVFTHVQSTRAILHDLGLTDIPRLLLFNKADRIDSAGFAPLLESEPGAMLVSSQRGLDQQRVLHAIEHRLASIHLDDSDRQQLALA